MINPIPPASIESRLWRVSLLAFVAMCASDILATCMVVFEARLNAPVAGLFDVLGWIASLTCSALALEEIIKNGWRTRKSLTIIFAVSLANFAGTYAGVGIASALTHH
jgi:hypothetical protein